MSVAFQMLTNGGDTEGLFRAAIMHSGGPIPTGDIELQQSTYDTIVEQVGCTDAKDTLQCLREASWDALMAAAATLPGSASYPVSGKAVWTLSSGVRL